MGRGSEDAIRLPVKLSNLSKGGEVHLYPKGVEERDEIFHIGFNRGSLPTLNGPSRRITLEIGGNILEDLAAKSQEMTASNWKFAGGSLEGRGIGFLQQRRARSSDSSRQGETFWRATLTLGNRREPAKDFSFLWNMTERGSSAPY